MKINRCIGGTLIAACTLTGCMSSSVGWFEKGAPPKGTVGGIYAIESNLNGVGENLIKEHGVKVAEKDKRGVPAKGSALPVKVRTTSSTTVDATGGIATVNNIFSFCTLGIWPYVKTETCDCTVDIVTPHNKVSKPFSIGMRKWSSFILPIAVLPCPGVGDWRNSDRIDVYQQKGAAAAVASILTEEFYNAEMTKYIEIRQSVIKKLQAVIDNEQE